MSVALTNNVSYNLKPTSVKCHRKQLVIPASNKTTFSPSDTMIFYLPSLRGNVMDGHSGYLRFSVKPTTTGYVDNTAHSFIDRIQTYGAGGQLIDDIQNYAVLANMMTDLQLSQSEKIGLSGTLGTEDDYGFVSATSAITANNFPSANVAQYGAFTDCDITNTNRKGRKLTTATTYTFCIPLLHPFFTLSEKYIPVFAMSDDTRLEITLSTLLNALVTSTAYEVSNPEIYVDYIEFDSSVFPLIEQTYAGHDLIIPAQSYHYYSSQIASGTSGNISQIIPAKQQSARAFFFAFRPAETQATAGYAVSSRVNPFYTAGDYFALNVGGQKVPQAPIKTRTTGEFSTWFASTQTALHAFNSLEMNGCLNRTYYQVSATQTGHQKDGDSYRNGFCLGINLDSLRGQNQTQNSGISLANITTYYEGYITTNPVNTSNTAESVSVDTYLLHDVMFVIDASGNVSVRF